MITFDVEAQAYQAFSQLKNDSVNSASTILQMAVIKNGTARSSPVDGFDSGIDSTDDTWTGGLIGSAVGILGGLLWRAASAPASGCSRAASGTPPTPTTTVAHPVRW